MFKVFYDCHAMREVDGVRAVGISLHPPLYNLSVPLSEGLDRETGMNRVLLLLLPLLTAKSNLHVFLKLIVMMAFVGPLLQCLKQLASPESGLGNVIA